MKARFAFPYRKNHWDKWDNWDTRRKPAWLRGVHGPNYAFVTGTRLGQLGHFGIRMHQDVAQSHTALLGFSSLAPRRECRAK